MAVVERHAPGEFCWVELGTVDREGAKAFYAELFGWTAKDSPISQTDFYTMFQLNGHDVAGMYVVPKDSAAAGTPPHWGVYVAVESADDAIDQAERLGGEIIAKPFDVFDVGRMGFFKDPTGAVLAVWQAYKHKGVGVRGENGALCWSELATRDTAKAAQFYSQLFGWGIKTESAAPMPYTQFVNQGQAIGGMLSMTEEWGDAPPHWVPYFLVADCRQSSAKAVELSGRLCVEPTNIPNIGTFAVIQDPHGAAFAIIEPAAVYR